MDRLHRALLFRRGPAQPLFRLPAGGDCGHLAPHGHFSLRHAFTRTLVEDFGPRLDDEGRRVCSIITRSAQTMGKLIDDLLGLSRIGRAEIQASPVNMAALTKSTFFQLTTPEERERIDFRVGPLPGAQGDPMLLRQAWMNLLGNAVKFSSKKERAVIEVGAERREDGTIYTVRDNGAVFDMAFSGKLFGVFQRLHGANEFEGTGVGLAIVQRIILRHGGMVWGEGKVNEGATFYFTLPGLRTGDQGIG